MKLKHIIYNVAILLFALIINFISTCPLQASDDPPSINKEEAKGTLGVKASNCFGLFEADDAGHTSENAYLLALACHYNYPDKLDVSPFEDFEQFQRKYRELFTPWGIDTFEFIQADGRTYDTELIVMSKSDADFVIVVFRGSERIKGPLSAIKDSILTDANCKLVDVSADLGEGVMVHAGFWNAFLPVRDDLVAAIERQGGFLPDTKLWITGNSLGAGLGDLSAAWLEKQGRDIHAVYTFGAPMCGNEAFRRLYEEKLSIRCQRYVNANDIVPLLPPATIFRQYRHVGTINNIKKDGSISLNDKPYKGIGSPLKHYQEFYTYRLYHLLPPELKDKMPPPPPLPAMVKPFV